MFWNRGGNNVGLMSIFLACSVTQINWLQVKAAGEAKAGETLV